MVLTFVELVTQVIPPFEQTLIIPIEYTHLTGFKNSVKYF